MKFPVSLGGLGTIGRMTNPEEERARVAATRRIHMARTNKCWIQLPADTALTSTAGGLLEDGMGRQFTIYRGYPEATPNKVLYFRIDDEQNGIVSYFERFVGE